MKPRYSVIVPIYNEAENLEQLHPKLFTVMKGLQQPFEILYINDGSTDDSSRILKKFSLNKNVKVITLRQNLGKSFVYNVGFQKALGEVIITIDADLQDDPREIPKLLKKMTSEYDFVIGWRKERLDKQSKIWGSKLFNKLVNLIFKSRFHDIDSGLKAINKKSLEGIFLYGDFHRYLPLLLTWNGFRGKEIEVKHHRRRYGQSKYTYIKVFSAIYDLFSAWLLWRFSQKPMHFFGAVGLILFSAGLLINIYLVIIKLLGEAIGSRPLLFLGILLTVSGIQFITTGFVADLIIRTKSDTNLDKFVCD